MIYLGRSCTKNIFSNVSIDITPVLNMALQHGRNEYTMRSCKQDRASSALIPKLHTGLCSFMHKCFAVYLSISIDFWCLIPVSSWWGSEITLIRILSFRFSFISLCACFPYPLCESVQKTKNIKCHVKWQ